MSLRSALTLRQAFNRIDHASRISECCLRSQAYDTIPRSQNRTLTVDDTGVEESGLFRESWTTI